MDRFKLAFNYLNTHKKILLLALIILVIIGIIIIPKKKFKIKTPVFAELLDKPDLKINVVKVCRDLNSYGEAINLLNKEAYEKYLNA